MDQEKKATTDNRAIKLFDFVKIHWKVQAIVHFALSLPIAFLTVFSWGIPLPALARLSLAYIDLYFFIYFPLYYFLPSLTLRPITGEIKKFNNKIPLTDKELTHLITYLINYPLPIAIFTAFIEFSAFVIGAWVWTTGIFVPELRPIITIALLETFILGAVVAINISFLNLIMIETHTRNVVENITRTYSKAFDLKIKIRRFSMYTKVFFLILLTTIAGEISIFIFFTTYILSTNPEKFIENTAFVISVILINVLYIFILAPIVAGNFTTPINKLVQWIRDISSGNTDSRIRFITNDETGDIIRGSNIMVDRLEKSRDVIELEKNKLSTILYGVIDGVIALNSNKHITLLNKAGEDITLWKCEQATGEHIDTILRLTNANNQKITSKDYCPSISVEHKISEQYSLSNLKLTTRDGKEKFVNISCSKISQKIGSDTSYIITFHDMTDEKQLENMKLDFVSMAAHELRTPITVIKGYLDVFLEENKSKLDSEQIMMISRVYYTSQQLSTLIENLLNVSKIERNSMNLNREDINWGKFVKDSIQSLKYLAQEKQIKLECIISDSFKSTISADKTRMGEVLNNLISNAITYTQSGGIVRVIIEDHPDNITTHIQDTGIGIPPEAISHLFTKFFRVTSSLVSNSKGNGLGLYLTKAIIDIHHGQIWVHSELGHGSTFSFSLPKKIDNLAIKNK